MVEIWNFLLSFPNSKLRPNSQEHHLKSEVPLDYFCYLATDSLDFFVLVVTEGAKVLICF